MTPLNNQELLLKIFRSTGVHLSVDRCAEAFKPVWEAYKQFSQNNNSKNHRRHFFAVLNFKIITDLETARRRENKKLYDGGYYDDYIPEINGISCDTGGFNDLYAKISNGDLAKEINNSIRGWAKENQALSSYVNLDFSANDFGEDIKKRNASLSMLLNNLNNVTMFQEEFDKELPEEGSYCYLISVLFKYLNERLLAEEGQKSTLALYTFLSELCHPERKHSVFDPISNDAGLLSAVACQRPQALLSNFCSAKENDENDLALNITNMLICGFSICSDYASCSSEYDNIVANVELGSLERLGLPTNADGAISFIKNILAHKWNKQGRAIIAVPYTEVCGNQQQERTFRQLAEFPSLRKVITLRSEGSPEASKVVFLFDVNNQEITNSLEDFNDGYTYIEQEPKEFFGAVIENY